MKRLLLAFLLVLLTATFSFANKTTLVWEPSPSADVDGYVLYYDSDGTDPWDYRLTVGNVLTYEILDLAPGDWRFTVTAYGPAGESEYSNIVTKTIDAFTPPDDVIHIPMARPAPVTIQIIIESPPDP